MTMTSAQQKIAKSKEYFQKYLETPNEKQELKFAKLVIKLVREAAYSGDANGQYELGQLYEDTGLLGENPEKAFTWYLKAGKQKHLAAINSVGFAYYNGDGVKINELTAIKWFSKGVKAGCEHAQKNLALAKKNL